MQPEMSIDYVGDSVWILNGHYHRTDGPAVIHMDGTMEWIVYGNLHRTDGPAVEWADGEKSWYWNDINLTFDKWLDLNNELTDEQIVMLKLIYA